MFMMECLALARKGGGFVSPTRWSAPFSSGTARLSGGGTTAAFGGAHAEVEAIRRAVSPVRGSTLYVNLEPCNITGKTPPCTDLLISSGIARVVAGMRDPNPAVNGAGLRALKRSGIAVTEGVLGKECRKLNESFRNLSGRAFLRDPENRADARRENRPFTRTSPEPHQRPVAADRPPSPLDVRRRSRRRGNVRSDDPRLTARARGGRDPLRVVSRGASRSTRAHGCSGRGSARRRGVEITPEAGRMRSPDSGTGSRGRRTRELRGRVSVRIFSGSWEARRRLRPRRKAGRRCSPPSSENGPSTRYFSFSPRGFSGREWDRSRPYEVRN